MFGDPIAYANSDFIAAQNFTRNQAASYRVISAVGPEAQPELIHRIEQHLADRNFQVLKVQSGAAFRKTATSAISMLSRSFTFLWRSNRSALWARSHL